MYTNLRGSPPRRVFLAILIIAGLTVPGCKFWGPDEPVEGPLPNLLKALNEAREQSRLCGTTEVAAADPVAWNDLLADAALRHAKDLAAEGLGGHVGSDGSTSRSRIADTGYEAVASGEIVVIGGDDLAEALAAWLDSPGHCNILMGSIFTDGGAATAGGHVYVVVLGSQEAVEPK